MEQFYFIIEKLLNITTLSFNNIIVERKYIVRYYNGLFQIEMIVVLLIEAERIRSG